MKQAILVGVAGAFGAVIRVFISSFFPENVLFPVGTLFANIIATFFLCLIAAGILQKTSITKKVEEAVTVGFLGSLSTFSALSIETITLVEQERWMIATSYITLSFFGGIVAGICGLMFGKKWIKNDDS